MAGLELPHVDQAVLELPYAPLADLELRIPSSPAIDQAGLELPHVD